MHGLGNERDARSHMQTQKATENRKNERNKWNSFLWCRRNSRAVIGIQFNHYEKLRVWRILVRRPVMCLRHANSHDPERPKKLLRRISQKRCLLMKMSWQISTVTCSAIFASWFSTKTGQLITYKDDIIVLILRIRNLSVVLPATS